MDIIKTKVKEIRQITKDIKTIQFEIPESFNFKCGQYILLGINGEFKAYSISSSPLQKRILEITVKKVGEFSSEIFDLKKNDNVKIKGPIGNMVLSEREKENNVFISGGSGIGPFIGMLWYARDKPLRNNQYLFFSARTPSEIKGFQNAIGKSSDKEYIFWHVTRPYLEPKIKWEGLTGRITIDEIKKNVEGFFDADYYIVGPSKMVEMFTNLLKEKKIPKKQIHIEKWN